MTQIWWHVCCCAILCWSRQMTLEDKLCLWPAKNLEIYIQIILSQVVDTFHFLFMFPRFGGTQFNANLISGSFGIRVFEKRLCTALCIGFPFLVFPTLNNEHYHFDPHFSYWIWFGVLLCDINRDTPASEVSWFRFRQFSYYLSLLDHWEDMKHLLQTHISTRICIEKSNITQT